eukprot:TRINITY_DN427_c0_g1_i2.p1 TRINITY_DN427_c0_g1~~TRINITY_DN427_c0_g1_i2.p1  ORF type:complete len:126 (+),score=60.73 TRINITY_DN427_c0_g1_i2:141-518(+)
MSKTVTMDEVAKHVTSDDIWMVIKGKAYDVTKFLDEHPGGEEVLLDMAGKDATQEYDDVGHSDEADELMKDYLVGTVVGGAAKSSGKSKSASAKSSDDGNGISSIVLPVVLLVALFFAAKHFELF